MCRVFVAITFSAGTVIDVVRNPSAPIAEAVRPVAVRDHCVVNYWDSGALRKLKSIDGTIIIDSPELMFVDHRSNIRFIEPMVLGAMKSHGTFDDSHLISSIRRREIAAFVFGPKAST